MDWSPIITAGIGFVSGTIGSLFAPWSTWGVEKRRDTRAHRRQRIEGWYEMVHQHAAHPSEILQDKRWLSLKSHLDKQVVEPIERSVSHVRVSDGPPGAITSHHELNGVLQEIEDLKREWKLRD
jgi:hypothetical protein